MNLMIKALLAISLGWCLEAHAGQVIKIFPKKKVVVVKLAEGEGPMRLGDKVKLSAIHQDVRGTVRAKKRKRIRVKVSSLGVLRRGSKVDVVKTNKGLTPKQEARELRLLRKENPMSFAVKGGLFHNRNLGLGIDGHYSLSSDWQIGLTLGRSEVDMSERCGGEVLPEDRGLVNPEYMWLSATFGIVQLRYFVTPSLYVSGGVGYRQMQTFFAVNDTDEGIEHEVNVLNEVGHVALGHLWIFKSGLYLGMEWIGFVQPFSSDESRSISKTGDLSDEAADFDQFGEELALEYANEGNYQGAMAQIGILF